MFRNAPLLLTVQQMIVTLSTPLGALVRCPLLDWPVFHPGWVWHSSLQDSGAGHTGKHKHCIQRILIAFFEVHIHTTLAGLIILMLEIIFSLRLLSRFIKFYVSARCGQHLLVHVLHTCLLKERNFKFVWSFVFTTLFCSQFKRHIAHSILYTFTK